MHALCASPIPGCELAESWQWFACLSAGSAISSSDCLQELSLVLASEVAMLLRASAPVWPPDTSAAFWGAFSCTECTLCLTSTCQLCKCFGNICTGLVGTFDTQQQLMCQQKACVAPAGAEWLSSRHSSSPLRINGQALQQLCGSWPSRAAGGAPHSMCWIERAVEHGHHPQQVTMHKPPSSVTCWRLSETLTPSQSPARSIPGNAAGSH